MGVSGGEKMAQSKYRIFEVSARAVMSYAARENGQWHFALDRSATEKCKSFFALHEQDGNALFFQIMCVLQGDDFSEPTDDHLIDGLADVIFYMDFPGIFDRSSTLPRQQIRKEKARDMFRPEGVCLDFGSGMQRYLAFERSNSMSRQSKLSFLREDVYCQVRRRIQMDMTVGNCQLSKLYAYNGLILSSGVRLDGIGIDKPHRVIVVDNPVVTARDVPVITVEDDGTQNSTRKYIGWSGGRMSQSPALTGRASFPSSMPKSSTGHSVAPLSTPPSRSVCPMSREWCIR